MIKESWLLPLLLTKVAVQHAEQAKKKKETKRRARIKVLEKSGERPTAVSSSTNPMTASVIAYAHLLRVIKVSGR